MVLPLLWHLDRDFLVTLLLPGSVKYKSMGGNKRLACSCTYWCIFIQKVVIDLFLDAVYSVFCIGPLLLTKVSISKQCSVLERKIPHRRLKTESL